MKFEHSIRTVFEVLGRRYFPTKKHPQRSFQYGGPVDVLAIAEFNNYDYRYRIDLLPRRGLLWIMLGAHEGLRHWWTQLPVAWRGWHSHRGDYTARIDITFFLFYLSIGWCHTPNFAKIDPITFLSQKEIP